MTSFKLPPIALLIFVVGSFHEFSASGQDTSSRPSQDSPRETADPYFNAPDNAKNGSAHTKKSPGSRDPLDRYRITERHPADESSEQGRIFEAGHVLAVVGEEPIFVGDILFEVNQLIEQHMPNAPEAIRETERPKLVKRMLPRYIDQKLLLIDAKRQLPEGVDFEKVISQSEKDFDEKVLDSMIESAGVSGAAEYDALLRAQGSSLSKLRRAWTVDQIARYFLSKKLEINSDVSRDELLEYYQHHADEFASKARVKWEQVMVRFDRFTSREEAQKQIVEMGNKIVYGASLDAVAKKMSHCFHADQGGRFDWTSKGSLASKELDEALFSLPVGELSEIIETRLGYHIVRVIERQDAGMVQFRDAQVDIRAKLADEKRNRAFDDYMTKLRQEIPVEIFELPESAAFHFQPHVRVSSGGNDSAGPGMR
jgi:hypothetical protein